MAVSFTPEELRDRLNASVGSSPDATPVETPQLRPLPTPSDPNQDVLAPAPAPAPEDVPASLPPSVPEDVPADLPAPQEPEDPFNGFDFSEVANAQARAALSSADAANARNQRDKGNFRRGFESSIDQTQASLGAFVATVGDLTGHKDLAEYGQRVANANTLEAMENQGPQDIFDINSASDFVGWLAFNTGSFAVDMATFAAGGGVGGLVAKGALKGLAKSGAKSMAARLAERQGISVAAAKKNLTKYAAETGTATMGISMGIGETSNQIYAATGERNAKAALIAGTVSGALDVAPFFRIASKITKDPAKLSGMRDRVLEYAKEFMAQGGMEGFTELTQEALQSATVKYLQDSITDWSVEDFKQLANAAAAGFFMGGSLGLASPAIQDTRRLAGPSRKTADALKDIVLDMKDSADLKADRDAIKERMANAKAFMKRQASVGDFEGAAQTKQWLNNAKVAVETVYKNYIDKKVEQEKAAGAEAKPGEAAPLSEVKAPERGTIDDLLKKNEARPEPKKEPAPAPEEGPLEKAYQRRLQRSKDIDQRAKSLGIDELTPVQSRVLRAVMKGEDELQTRSDTIKEAENRIEKLRGVVKDGEGRAKELALREIADLEKSIDKHEARMLELDATARRAESALLQGRAKPETDAEVADIAKDTDLNPSDAQVEANNYKKASFTTDIGGVTIENPKGSTRTGRDPDNPWKQEMKDHYGDIKGVKGADGDNMDVFIGSVEKNKDKPVYIVNQKNPDGSFDEHKVMLGYGSREEARKAYLRNYPKGWDGIKSLVAMTHEDFKNWTRNGDTTLEAENTVDENMEELFNRVREAKGKLPLSHRLVDKALDVLDSIKGFSEIANSFLKGLESNQAVSLIGMKVKNVSDLAALVQVYRNPNFETMRYIFTDKNGVVVKVDSVSSRLPDSSATFAEGVTVEDLVATAKDNGWRVTLTHNHPDGRPRPSRADMVFTKKVKERLEKSGAGHLFAGHIVTNHTQYGYIGPGGKFSIKSLTQVFPKATGPVKRSSDILGQVLIDGAEFAEAVSRYVNNPDEQISIVGTGPDGEVAYLGTLDVNGGPIDELMSSIRRTTNATSFAAIVPKSPGANPSRVMEMLSPNSGLSEVLSYDGDVLRTFDGKPKRDGEAVGESSPDNVLDTLTVESSDKIADLQGAPKAQRQAAHAAHASLELESTEDKPFWQRMKARAAKYQEAIVSTLSGEQHLVKAVQDALKSVPTSSIARKIYKGVLGIYNLFDVLEEHLPRIKQYRSILERYDSIRGELMEEAHSSIAPKWRALRRASKKEYGRLNNVIHATTALKYDPSTKKFQGENIPAAKDRIKELNTALREGKQAAEAGSIEELAWAKISKMKKADRESPSVLFSTMARLEHSRDLYNSGNLEPEIKRLKRTVKAYEAVRKIVNTIDAVWGNLSPEAKELYSEQADFHRKIFNKVQEGRRRHIQALDIDQETRNRLLRELDEASRHMKQNYPYAPFKRFGRYWVSHYEEVPGVGRVQIVKQFQKENDQLDYVAKHETVDGLNELKSGVDLKDLAASLDASPKFLQDYMAVLNSKISKLDPDSRSDRVEIAILEDQKATLMDQYLAARPEGSFVKSYIERDNIFGFEEDAAASFATQARFGAEAASKAHFSWALRAELQELIADVQAAQDPLRHGEEMADTHYQAWKLFYDAIKRDNKGPAFPSRDSAKGTDMESAVEYLHDFILPHNTYADKAHIGLAKERMNGAKARLETIRKAKSKIKGHDRSEYRKHLNWLGDMLEGVVSDFENRQDPSQANFPRLITQFGFFNAIALSPFSAMLNSTQLYLATVPAIGSKYGNKKVALQVAKLQKEFVENWQTRVKKRLGKGPNAEGARTSLKDQPGLMDETEKQAFEDLIHRGRLDRGITAEMILDEGSLGLGNRWDRIVNASAGMFAFTENMNREVTGLIAFRMAYNDPKYAHLTKQERYDRALDYASEMIILTQGEYATANAGKWFRNDFGRIALQFKKYTTMVLYMYARTAHKAFMKTQFPEGVTPEAKKKYFKLFKESQKDPSLLAKSKINAELKKRGLNREVFDKFMEVQEQRKFFASLFVAQTLMGGAGSVLGAGILMGLAEGLVNATLDDEAEIDLGAWLESKAMEELPDPLVTLITKGPFNMLGMDVSSRIDLDVANMILRTPDFDRASGDELQSYVLAMFGPVLGGYMAQSLPRALNKWDTGQTSKAFESGLPNVAARNVVKGLRRLMVGERNAAGALVDDVGVYGAILTAMGVAPASVAHQYEVNAARSNAKKRYMDKKSALLRMLYEAIDDDDNEGEIEVRAAIEAFNDNFPPELWITEKTIKRSLSGRKRRIENSVNGITIPKYLRPFILQQLSFDDDYQGE